MQYYHLIRMVALLTLTALSLAACAPATSQWHDASIKSGAQVQADYLPASIADY